MVSFSFKVTTGDHTMKVRLHCRSL